MPGIPAGPLLLVSPHLDDAMLSCFAVLERGEAVDVLTVCAGSPDPPQRGWWDVECGFASSAESIPARLAEDEAAFAGMPHERRYLELFEGQYIAGRRSESDRDAIVEAVSAWISANAKGTVAVPAGAGGRSGAIGGRLRRVFRRPLSPPPHPDHLFVRDAVLTLPIASLLLYEEVPYLYGGAADEEARRVAADGWEQESLVVPIDRTAKAARLAAYASQIAPLSDPEARLDDPNVLPAVERYWALRRSSTSP
jgi:hypothetical protein